MSAGSVLYSHYLVKCFVTGQMTADDSAHFDVPAEGFWGYKDQRVYFDVRFINPLSQTYSNHTLTICYKSIEEEKKCMYNERIIEVEHGTFSPLVFSITGDVGPIATCFMKRMALLHSEEQ